MADVDPTVKAKERAELMKTGRRLLVESAKHLLSRVRSGEATAAELNAVARLLDLIGLDKILDDGAARELERTLEELEALDAEERDERRTPFDWAQD